VVRTPVAVVVIANATPRIAIIKKLNVLGLFPLITLPARFSGRFNFKPLRVRSGFVLTVDHI